MNKTELTKLNVGYNLDWLMNLDPRGYGVCRILYDGAIKYTGKPLSLNGAEGLVKNIKKGEKVFILTGFILPLGMRLRLTELSHLPFLPDLL